MPKPTHIISIQPTGKETHAEHLKGGRQFVYGKADLDRIKKAARKEGRNVTVHEMGED